MLALETSQWSQQLWRGQLRQSRPARQVVAAGRKRQAAFDAFADDVHGLLYLRSAPVPLPEAPPWATDLLAQAQGLAEWPALKSRCRVNGFAAGIAAEVLLRALVDLVPQEAYEPQPETSETRRALRQALRAAGKEVDTAEATMDAVLGTGGSGAPDTALPGVVALEQVRALYALLRDNSIMQQMTAMAGRLQRMVARHKKAQAVGQVGAITGVTIGGDLARLLPGELAGLRGSRLARLQVLATIQGRKALQYEVRGVTPETKGPVLVLLDKSGSLDATQVAWEAAFALTLLTLCQAQRRVFALVNFDEHLYDECVVEPGQGVTADLLQALCHQPGGGTNFELPLARALDLLGRDARLGKADLFFLTDGRPNRGGGPTAATLAALQHLSATEGLSIFGVGIGDSARLDTIRAVATETYQLQRDPRASEDLVIPLLAAVA